MNNNPTPLAMLAASAALLLPQAVTAAATAAEDAARFGALETVYSASLSPDGKRLVYVGPRPGSPGTIAAVIDLTARSTTAIGSADGKPLDLRGCNWSAVDRLVCTLEGTTRVDAVLAPVSRTMAVDVDGRNMVGLGQRDSQTQVRMRQFDGFVIDWLEGTSGSVLMARSHVSESKAGALAGRRGDGLAVDRIDTRTGKAEPVERPDADVSYYATDGKGNVRLRTLTDRREDGMLRGVDRHYYRAPGSREWKSLGIAGGQGEDTIPLAVDPTINAAYVLQRLEGRLALYRVALDGSGARELVFASKEVDVDNVIRVGRTGKVVGAAYTTDRRHAEYFDPEYRNLHTSLSRSLPEFPLHEIISASADEQVLLVWAGSDVDPGRFFVYDRAQNSLLEAASLRPALKGRPLSPMKAVSYPAADGTQIPGYLTLPPGVTEARGLPAIVMPHGGPGARDSWGFDWLSQYFAQRGFVVLQPNFRGSTGYGEDWYLENGFRSWKTSIGDVNDAGRWLVAQGIADPARLAIVGWSYGGYAALQAQVLDPELFKATVAIAPVTDLDLMKRQARAYTNARLVADFIGSGPHVEEGSPARNARRFQAPVLLFHPDQDLNVDVQHSRRMEKALQDAGKPVELIVYPGLEHSIRDGKARADMLQRSNAFLRRTLGIPDES